MEIPKWIWDRRPKAFDGWSDKEKSDYVEGIKERSRQRANKARLADLEKSRAENRERNKRYKDRHKERLAPILKQRAKEAYWSDPQKYRDRANAKRTSDPEAARRRDREYYRRCKEADPQFDNKKRKKLLEKRPELGVRFALGVRLNHTLKKIGMNKGGSSVVDFIGCSIDELRAHVEEQFRDGMSWANWGEVWELDHILPCASFDHGDEEQVKKCWHFSNYQPLLVHENREKSDKIIPE